MKTQPTFFLYAPHEIRKIDLYGLIGCSFLVVLSSYCIGHFVFQDFPNSADEHAYLFQASLFAEGKLTAPAHPQQEFLSPFYILTSNTKVFSLFPPGWPFILSFCTRLGVQDWVNPIISGCTIPTLFFMGWMVWGRRTGWIAVFLTAISPFFLFNGASYFSHPSCLLSIVLSICLLMLWERNAKAVWALLAGMTAAGAFSIREMTAVLALTVPFLWFMYHSSRRWRLLGYFLTGALPVLFLYLYYNQCVTGEWWLVPRFLQSSERLGFGDREIRVFDYVEIQHYGLMNGLTNLLRNSQRLFLWTFPGLPLLAAWGIWRKRRESGVVVMTISAAMLPIGYLLYPSDGGNQYGPRFYYESLGFLALAAAPAVEYFFEKTPNKKRVLGICAFILLLNVLLLAVHGNFHYRQIYERRTLYRLVEMRAIHNALVFVAVPSGDMTQGDLIRNPADFDKADVIYAWNLGEKNRELVTFFPNRTYYFFGRNAQNGSVYLERLSL